MQEYQFQALYSELCNISNYLRLMNDSMNILVQNQEEAKQRLFKLEKDVE